MLGRKTVEVEIIKDALEISQAKSTYRRCPYWIRIACIFIWCKAK